MINENDMHIDQFDVNMKVSKIIAKFASSAKKYNATDCIKALVGNIYKSCAGEHADLNVISLLKGADYISSFLTEEEFAYLYANGKEAFDFLFDIVIKRLNVTTLPAEICSLVFNNPNMSPFTDDYADEEIYLPFAGLSDFAVAKPKQKFIGEELDQFAWALGEVRNFFYNTNASIACDNCMGKSTKHKNIIATPPFGMRGEMSIDNIVQTLFDRLDIGGTMLICVPTSFLFNQGKTNTLRRMLVEKHALRQVCLFPSNLLENTAIPFAILTIDRFEDSEFYDCEGKTYDRSQISYYVRFVDYTSFVRDNRKYGSLYKLDIEAIRDAELAEILEKKDENFSITLNSKILLENEYLNLIPCVHIQNDKLASSLKEEEKLVPLRELIKSYQGWTSESMRGARKIRFSNLSDSILDEKKSFLDLPVEDISDAVYGVLDRGHLLLVSAIGTKPKPTIFECPEDVQFVYDHSVMPFQLKYSPISQQGFVTLEYIQSQIAQEYFIKQIEAIQLANGLQRLNTKAFLECKIKLVGSLADKDSALQKQVDIIRDIKEKLLEETVAHLSDENKALRNTQHNQYVAMMRERKHAMGQVLQKLLPGLNSIIKNIEKEPLTRDTVISSRNGITALDQLNQLYAYAARISTMNKHLMDEYAYGTPEEVWIGALIDEYTNKYFGANYAFEVIHPSVTTNTKIGSTENNVYFHQIKIAPSDFEQILDNIVANATKYGFTDKDKNYCIRIIIENSYIDAKEAVKITVVNNGNPLPKNMDEDRVFTYGQSSGKGEGLGGWQIKNIVKHYDGRVELKNGDGSDTEGFTVAYIITFPVINFNNIDLNEV